MNALTARQFDPEKSAARLAVPGFLILAVGVWLGHWYGGVLAAAGGAALLLACVSRSDGFLLVGPLLRFELARVARRGRVWVARIVLGLLLLGILALLYLSVLRVEPEALLRFDSTGADGPKLADFSLIFFGVYVAVMSFIGILFTPTAVAQLAAEKDARSLEFLLTTPLSNREIVLGKAGAGVGYILSLLVLGLPIVVAVSLFGGVTAWLLAVGVAFVLLSIFSAAGVAVWASVYSPKPIMAPSHAIRLMGLYVFLSFASRILLVIPATAGFPGVNEFVGTFGAGNPVLVGRDMGREIASGLPVADTASSYLQSYAVFHLLFGFAFGLTGIAHFRRVSAARAAVATDKPKSPKVNRRDKVPPIGDRPVYWKATHIDTPIPNTIWARLMRAVVWTVACGAIVTILVLWAMGLPVAAPVRNVLRSAAPIIAIIAILAGATFAASFLGRERKKDTLEPLLLTELSPRDILAGVWTASAMKSARIAAWLVGFWAVAALVGAVHSLAVPGLVLLLGVLISFSTSVGVWSSVGQKTAQGGQRRMFWVIMTVIGIVGGLSALFGVLEWTSMAFGNAAGGFPPMSMVLLTMRPGEPPFTGNTFDAGVILACIALWLGIYGLMSWRFWQDAVRRFDREVTPKRGESGEWPSRSA